MFKRFLVTTWRNFKRSKAFSVLNILGLAIGIACAGIILLWVEYYTTFNHTVKDRDRIFRMENAQVYGKDTYTFPVTPFAIRDELQNKYPGVETVVRYSDNGVNVTLGDRNFAEQGAYTDPEFLQMFSYEMLAGSAAAALNSPDGIAISAKVATAYFGSTEALGKTLLIDQQPYQIKGVFKDPADNMEFASVNILLPYSVYYNAHKDWDAWDTNTTGAWVKIKSGVTEGQVNQQLSGLAKSHNPDSKNTFFMYPMDRIALHGNLSGTKEAPGGRITMVKMFSLIALIILLIACINFMNLSTARSEKRSREIGLRKVLGSSRRQLVLRLLLEAVVMSFLALLLALLLIAVALPLFNGLIGLHLHPDLFNPWHMAFLLGLGLVSGLIAGLYPAFYLSSFNPIAALKGHSLKAGGAGWVRKVLVVLQFSVSAIIMVSIFVIYQQIRHMHDRDLGYNKNNVLYVSASQKLMASFPSLKAAVLQTGKVADLSLGSNTPLAMYNNGSGLRWEGSSSEDKVLITYVRTDDDYLKTLGIQLSSGRAFNQDPRADSNAVIINESLAKLMGKSGHVGGQIYYSDDSSQYLRIVGITRDFLYNNVAASKPAPLVFFNAPEQASMIFIRLKDGKDLSGTLATLKSVFAGFDGSQAFDYHFMDQAFENQFKQQRFTGALAVIFGGLAIIISCLGLFGLSAFMAEQRTREIGIRKVLGASVGSVVKMLTRDFILMVLLSCVIAFPVAYYLMNHYLMDFDYRISVQWYVFLVTAILMLMIAFITVSSQAFKAGRLNPVRAIKSE